jgi:hypothetical protein
MHMLKDDQLVWSVASAIGAFLGYLLHWLVSWGEWRKISGHEKLRLADFINSDPPGFWIGLVTTVIIYLSLPELGEFAWVKDMLGFVPSVNFFSAAVTAYCCNSVAIKLRNISRKIDGSGQ